MTDKPWDADPIVSKTLRVEQHKARMPWDDDPIPEGYYADAGPMEYAKGFAGGTTKGLVGFAGAPIDISQSILKGVGLLPEESEQVMGSDWILRQLKKGIDVPDPPDTLAGRVLARAGEEVGFAAVPSGALLKAAKGVPAVAKTSKSVLKNITQSFLDPIKRTPGKAAAGELIAATSAGLGGGAAKEIDPSLETTGQIAGGFLPVALTFTPTAMLIRLIKGAHGRFSSKAQIKTAERLVRKAMGGTLTRDDIGRLYEAQRLKKAAPGFDPSTAQATKSPALIATQRQLESEAEGDFLNFVVDKRARSEKAIQDFAERSAPVGDIDPEYIVDTASGRIKALGAGIEKQAIRNAQDQKDFAKGLPVIDRLATGKTLREGINDARLVASVRMTEAADELNLSGIDLTEKYNQWSVFLKEKYAPVSRFENKKSVPAIYKKIVGEIPEEAAEETAEVAEEVAEEITTTFLDIKSIRERISDDLIDAVGSANPDRRKVRFLTRLKKDVDKFWDSLDEQLGANYKAFRKKYFDEYVTPFESGAIFKSRNRDGTGFFKSRDEQVADIFLDNQSAAKQFNSIFADDPAMMQSLESSVWDRIRRDVAPDGIIDTKKLTKWINKRIDVLNELPSIKENVFNIQAAQESLLRRQVQLAARRDVIENKALAKQLFRYSNEEIPADRVLDSALKNPLRMASLKSLIKNDADAFNALKRVMWEKATKGSSVDTLQFVTEHKKSLQQLFTPQHFRNIEDIISMRAILEVTPVPHGRGYIPMPLESIEAKLGMKLPQASTRWYAFMTGRLAKSYLTADIARAILYNKGRMHAKDLFQTALYDPKVAEEMAGSIHALKMSEETANRLGTRLFALGIPYLRKNNELQNESVAMPPKEEKINPNVTQTDVVQTVKPLSKNIQGD